MEILIIIVGLKLSYWRVLCQCFNIFVGVLCGEVLVVEQIILKEFVRFESSKLVLFGVDFGVVFCDD